MNPQKRRFFVDDFPFQSMQFLGSKMFIFRGVRGGPRNDRFINGVIYYNLYKVGWNNPSYPFIRGFIPQFPIYFGPFLRVPCHSVFCITSQQRHRLTGTAPPGSTSDWWSSRVVQGWLGFRWRMYFCRNFPRYIAEEREITQGRSTDAVYIYIFICSVHIYIHTIYINMYVYCINKYIYVYYAHLYIYVYTEVCNGQNLWR